MNRLYIDGLIAGEPVFRMEPGEVPHLTFRLGVRHKTRSGEVRSEYYRVSAWHKAALWARDRLRRGQLVSVAGYLTQRTVRREEETLHCTEIVAEQFRALEPLGKAKAAPAQENSSADGAA